MNVDYAGVRCCVWLPRLGDIFGFLCGKQLSCVGVFALISLSPVSVHRMSEVAQIQIWMHPAVAYFSISCRKSQPRSLEHIICLSCGPLHLVWVSRGLNSMLKCILYLGTGCLNMLVVVSLICLNEHTTLCMLWTFSLVMALTDTTTLLPESLMTGINLVAVPDWMSLNDLLWKCF